MLNVRHKSTFPFLLLILVLLYFSSASSSTRLTRPRKLSINPLDFNAVLSWKASTLVTSQNRSAGHVITYTVSHHVWICKLACGYKWIVLSKCNRTTKLSCKLYDISADGNEYRVTAYYRDVTSPVSRRLSFLPHFEGQLSPPLFSLSFNKSNLTIHILNPPRVEWSGELLYDYLKSDIHGPYRLLYYVNYTRNNERSKIKDFDAGADILSFPVVKELGDEVCVRLQLRGKYSFKDGFWSEPKCIKELPKAWTTQGVIAASSILAFVILFLLIGAVLILTKKIKKFLKPAMAPLPYELRILADEMQKDKSEPSLDVAGEHVTLYCPNQSKKLAKKGSYHSLANSLKDIPSHVMPVTKNDYVVSRLGQSRSPPISILTLHGNKGDGNDNYVSDYVCVPSPDSGIGMTVEF